MNKLKLAREKSLQIRYEKRKQYFEQIIKKNSKLKVVYKSVWVKKIALAMLYLAEGSKRDNGTVVFCNSDPFVIALFLQLLRTCYKLNEEKIRCTVQCRADQDVVFLENYWSNITKIPLSKFLKAQVDRRTLGKNTKKINYKGVCRIDYYSAEIFHDLTKAPQVFFKGP